MSTDLKYSLDDLLHAHVIKQLEVLNDSPLSDNYFRKMADLIVKSLLDSVSKRRHDLHKDDATKTVNEKYHQNYIEMLEKIEVK